MPRGTKNPLLDTFTDAQLVKAVKAAGSIRKAAKHLKVPRVTLQDRVSPLLHQHLAKQQMPAPVEVSAPKRGKRCFIFSSAQDGTEIHEAFLTNLEAYAKHLNAKIHISGFTYNKSLFENHAKNEAYYHPRVEPYLTNHRFDILGKLFFCGEMNTLPTATDPLSGLEAYTQSKWGIFPHPRVQLKSIATMFKSPPKIIMTTGAVTHRNYVQKKAGIKAEFHHVIAAVLVEIDADGDFFCRHLIAEKDGSFQDLTTRVVDGKISGLHPVEAITWGDIHAEMLDPDTAAGSWGICAKNCNPLPGQKNMLDDLRPKHQFFHDVLDFRRRNHHNIDNPHHMFEMWVRGTESVQDEVGKVANFLMMTERPFCKSIVVDSNHDRALKRWLARSDYRKDPVNARFFLECQAAVYRAIEEQDDSFLLAEWAVSQCGVTKNVKFLKHTDSYVICPQAGGGIECALHGDEGANGAKGFVNTFARMGPKGTIAHHHGAAIFEGIWQVGHSCKRDMVFNRGGLSSWNPSHVVTYPSGRRAMITMWGRKWRAE